MHWSGRQDLNLRPPGPERWNEEIDGFTWVRELPPDPGHHECLTSAKMVAARLGVCTAVVYRLCEKGELPGLRIGGALRFERDVIRRYIERTRL
jgi:excisionase family DNA binding protein